MTRGVTKERSQDWLYVEGISAVKTHDHSQVRTGANISEGRRDAEHGRRALSDALHQGAETILDDGALLDLVPVHVQERTLETLRQVLTLLSQPQTVLLW